MIASDGLRIGEIIELLVDDDQWKVDAVRVKLSKDIADRVGAARGVFHAGTIEIPISMVQSIGGAAVLSVKVDELRQLQHPPEQVPSP